MPPRRAPVNPNHVPLGGEGQGQGRAAAGADGAGVFLQTFQDFLQVQ